MADETQRRDYEQLPADGDVVEQADAHPRHHAILAAYTGLERRELAFGLALILDEIAATFPTSTTNSQAVASPARLTSRVQSSSEGYGCRWEPH